VLRRHWKSCKARVDGGHAIPERERGGKHKRACDSCANMRKACNGELPCSECAQREKKCTYKRLVEDEPLPQAPFESQDTNRSETTWDLGLSTFFIPPRWKFTLGAKKLHLAHLTDRQAIEQGLLLSGFV
jgi:hypothetical protein